MGFVKIPFVVGSPVADDPLKCNLQKKHNFYNPHSSLLTSKPQTVYFTCMTLLKLDRGICRAPTSFDLMS